MLLSHCPLHTYLTFVQAHHYSNQCFFLFVHSTLILPLYRLITTLTNASFSLSTPHLSYLCTGSSLLQPMLLSHCPLHTYLTFVQAHHYSNQCFFLIVHSTLILPLYRLITTPTNASFSLSTSFSMLSFNASFSLSTPHLSYLCTGSSLLYSNQCFFLIVHSTLNQPMLLSHCPLHTYLTFVQAHHYSNQCFFLIVHSTLILPLYRLITTLTNASFSLSTPHLSYLCTGSSLL